MTIQDLIDIAKNEGTDPHNLHLVLGVSGTYYALTTADEQDPFNPNYVVMTLVPFENA